MSMLIEYNTFIQSSTPLMSQLQATSAYSLHPQLLGQNTGKMIFHMDRPHQYLVDLIKLHQCDQLSGYL